jgi:hypothetical protein
MRIPRRAGLLGAVGAATVALFAGAASAQTPSCQPAGPVVVRDADLVVWTQDAPQAHLLYIGCRTATGQPFTVLDFDNDCISPTGGCDGVAPRVRRTLRAGRWLALNVTNGINGALALADVSAGHAPRPSGYRSVEAPREIALNAKGTLAWIAPYVTKAFTRTRRLMICDTRCRATGSPARVLARGPRLHGLSVDAARVSWRAGARRQAVHVR